MPLCVPIKLYFVPTRHDQSLQTLFHPDLLLSLIYNSFIRRFHLNQATLALSEFVVLKIRLARD